MPLSFIESFNARLRDELLNETLLFSLAQVRAVLTAWIAAQCHSVRGNITPTEYANRGVPGPQRRDAALCRGLRAPPRCSTELYGLKYHRDSSHRWMKQGAQTSCWETETEILLLRQRRERVAEM